MRRYGALSESRRDMSRPGGKELHDEAGVKFRDEGHRVVFPKNGFTVTASPRFDRLFAHLVVLKNVCVSTRPLFRQTVTTVVTGPHCVIVIRLPSEIHVCGPGVVSLLMISSKALDACTKTPALASPLP